MPSAATSSSAPASPQVLTPSQAAVVTLGNAAHASPSTSTSSPETRSRNGSYVPVQRVECVRVAKKLRRDGRRFYVVRVFLQRSDARRRLSECVYKASPTSKLSAEAMRTFMMAEREPDFVVERRFFEFRRLRNAVALLVRANAAHAKTCADCQDLLRVVRSPHYQNWTIRRMFSSKEQTFALLTRFVNDLLMLTVSNSITEDMAGLDKHCRVRDRVAELLQEFLKRSYKPSLGII